jgi:hypothetical protein
MPQILNRILKTAVGGRFVETNKQLTAISQIHYALLMFRQNELECAITLAAAAEGVIYPTEEPHLFTVLKNSPLSRKEFDYNRTINWLKHPMAPDDFDIWEFEAAIIIVRAISKFFTVYRTGSPAMKSFVRWTFEQGHLPIPSFEGVSDQAFGWPARRSLKKRILSVLGLSSDFWRGTSTRGTR